MKYLFVLLFLVSCASHEEVIRDRNLEFKEYAYSILEPHKDSDKKLSKNKKAFNQWKISTYVDKFKAKTNNHYMGNNSIVGTFSNSATSDSKLYVNLMIDDSISFQLYEYIYSNPVIGIFSSVNYQFYIKDDKGVEHVFPHIPFYKGSDRLSFERNDYKKLNELFMNNKTLNFYISVSEYSSSNYLFTVKTENYGYVYRRFLEKKLKELNL